MPLKEAPDAKQLNKSSYFYLYLISSNKASLGDGKVETKENLEYHSRKESSFNIKGYRETANAIPMHFSQGIKLKLKRFAEDRANVFECIFFTLKFGKLQPSSERDFSF